VLFRNVGCFELYAETVIESCRRIRIKGPEVSSLNHNKLLFPMFLIVTKSVG